MKVELLLALLVVLQVGSTAEAQAILSPSPLSTVGATTPGAPPQQAKNPFTNLFARELQPPAPAPVTVALPIAVVSATPLVDKHPRVVCGMTLVPVDPDLDAAMRRVVPETGPKFTIRLVPPRLCGQ